jgi:hypothetical protein
MAAENDKGLIKYVPNALTIGRLVLTVVFLAMVLLAPDTGVEGTSNYLLVAFILFVVTGLTDIVDGKVARMYDVTSKFGRIVDPLADKFLVCGAFICFAIVGQPTLNKVAGVTPTGSVRDVTQEQKTEFGFERDITRKVGATKVQQGLAQGKAVADQYKYQGYANVATGISSILANFKG